MIGATCGIGVDTMLIAPVEVGDAAYTGAGAVIKDDVPDGALGRERERAAEHRGIRGRRKAAKMREDEEP